MKILVFSDSHNNLSLIKKAIERHSEDTDLILHLGDCVSDSKIFEELCPAIANINIFGNCDYFSCGFKAYDEKILELWNTGHSAFVTHGHNYCVNKTTDILFHKAKISKCSIAFYGHTHIAEIKERNGIILMNPGSSSNPRTAEPPSYGIVNIDSGVIMPSIIYDK